TGGDAAAARTHDTDARARALSSQHRSMLAVSMSAGSDAGSRSPAQYSWYLLSFVNWRIRQLDSWIVRPRQPEHALGEDVLLDIVRSATETEGWYAEHVIRPHRRVALARL